MRILWVNSVCGTGSTGKIVAALFRAVQTNGGEGRVLYGVGTAPEELQADAIRFSSKIDYYRHNALSRLTDHAGCYSKHATRRMIDEIKAYDPDLIHLHTLHGYYLNTDLLFAFLAQLQKPVVWTLHDCWAFTGHCTHFSDVGCFQWKTGCRNCMQLRRYPKCDWKGDTARNYERKRAAFTAVPNLTITAPSNWLTGVVRQSFLGEYPTFTIPNGIDLSCFFPRQSNVRKRLGLEEKRLILGAASVWNRQKGLEDLAALAKMLPDSCRLLLVGIRKEQKKLLPENVVTMERLSSQTELAELYSAADVFVNPSREETMGLTTVEALACGTPAVVYNSTAVPEVVDEKSGIVVQTGDVDALYQAVMACNLRREDALARGRMFSLERQNASFLELYHRLIRENDRMR